MSHRIKPIMPFIKDNHNKVETALSNYEVIPESGCWEWTKTKCPRGYGQALKFMAHRLSYAFHNKQDPGDKLVCHKCDNPKCINPDHLFLGTHKENMADMVKKGRSMLKEPSGKSDREMAMSRKLVANYTERMKEAGFIKVNSSSWVDLDQAERMRAIYRKAKREFEESGK